MGKLEDWANAKRLSNTENLSYDLWVTEDTQPFVLALYIYLAVLKNRSDVQSEWQECLDKFTHRCGDTIHTAVSEVPNLVGDWNAVKNRPFSEAWSRFEPRWNGLWDEMSSGVEDIIDPYNRRLQLLSGTGERLEAFRSSLSDSDPQQLHQEVEELTRGVSELEDQRNTMLEDRGGNEIRLDQLNSEEESSALRLERANLGGRPAKLISFDIDGTLDVGEPPGLYSAE